MKKILDIEEAVEVSKQMKDMHKTIVLAGGCFDILHIGHITFLKKAKEQGDTLILLLESDKAIQTKKGKDRPIHCQKDRATILACLSMVDYVIMLPKLDNNGYDAIIAEIRPDIIATTKFDPTRAHKERQAKIVGAQVLDVVDPIVNKSSSKIAELLAKEL